MQSLGPRVFSVEQGFFLAMCGRRLKSRWNTGFLGSRAASQSEHDAETGEVGSGKYV